jgi:hypothetical protein
MKTKELIRQLLELDPTQEGEVVTNCYDILFVEALDDEDTIEVLTRKESNGCHITGGKFVDDNRLKLNLIPYPIEEVYLDHGCLGRDFHLDLSDTNEWTVKRITTMQKEWDKQIKNIREKREEGFKQIEEKENESKRNTEI